MRKMKRRLSSYRSWKNERRATKGKKFRDAIAGSHAKNKRIGMSFKGLMMRRRWNNKKLGYKRQRYFKRAWA